MKPVNTIIGAVVAALIGFFTAFLALLQQEGIDAIGDISQEAWIVLIVGMVLMFLKDLQAIWTRRQINKLTKSGDGGI